MFAQQPKKADDVIITTNLSDVTSLTKVGDADVTKTSFMGKQENLTKKAFEELKKQGFAKGAGLVYISTNQFIPDARTYLNKVQITGVFYKAPMVIVIQPPVTDTTKRTGEPTQPNTSKTTVKPYDPSIDFVLTGCTGNASAQTVTVYFTFANPRKVNQSLTIYSYDNWNNKGTKAIDENQNQVNANSFQLANSSGSGSASIELLTGGLVKGSIVFINVLPTNRMLSLAVFNVRSQNWDGGADAKFGQTEIYNLPINWDNASPKKPSGTSPNAAATNASQGDDYLTYNDLQNKLNAGQDAKNKKVILDNIYFETDKDVLTDDSKTTLQNVLKLLIRYPKLKITILGHTDNVGRDDDNLSLSISRAHAVVNYLVSKGIDRDRMFYKGFGSTAPIGDNNTEDGRAKNRRTELQVMEQ